MSTTGAGLEGVIAGESEICYIDGYAGVLSYRGYNIHTLAEHATFEEVVYLLWNGRLPTRGELDAPYAFRGDLTPYARWGDWIAWLCAGVALVLLLWRIRETLERQSPA